MPVQGRNWMALLLLAPGSRTTSTTGESPLPARNGGEVREYQTNVDGQQVTNTMGGGGQHTFSQEMIGELQFISNRFDATQGRSPGVQVVSVRARRARPSSLSAVRHRGDDAVHGQVCVPRAAGGVDEAHEQPLAGSGDVQPGGLWTGVGSPLEGVSGSTPALVTFPLAADLEGEYGLDVSDQRHRMVFNGIWQVGRGFQVSGIHYTGIGQRSQTSYGAICASWAPEGPRLPGFVLTAPSCPVTHSRSRPVTAPVCASSSVFRCPPACRRQCAVRKSIIRLRCCLSRFGGPSRIPV